MKWLKALSRQCPACVALVATSVPVLAQSSAPPAPASHDEIIQMSKFEVTTTQGHGYVSANSVSAFKTNEVLLNIPQVDTVLTRDLITDLGYNSAAENLQYFGVNNLYAGEQLRLRGGALITPYIDEMPDMLPFADASWYDSYEVIKGPAQVLYLNAALSGIVLKQAKKPLPFKQDVVTLSGNSWGKIQATVDLTGPMAPIGDATLAYRFVSSFIHGNEYWANDVTSMSTTMGGLTVNLKNTTLTQYFTYWRERHDLLSEAPLTPEGKVWTGGGGPSNAYIPPNGLEYLWGVHYYSEMDNRISQNWENRVKVGNVIGRRMSENSIGYNVSEDWANKNLIMNARQDNIKQQYWTILDDWQGNYDIGPFKNIDAFGGGFYNYVLVQKAVAGTAIPRWTTSPLYSAAAGGVVIPMVGDASRRAVNSLSMPTWQEYDANYPANQGSHNEQNVYGIYWQHTIDIIPKYLTLVGGWSWSGITTFSTANVSTLPWTTIQTPAQTFVHRLGAVFKVTKEISLYAMQGTSFTPPPSGNLLQNGLLPPVLLGKGQEVGLKTAFFNGRLSTDLAWFKDTTTNVEALGGIGPNGYPYYNVIGGTIQEGVDGDLAYSVVPGWQVIGSFYAGHDRDAFGKPVATSYDNSWSLFTRYDFQKGSALHRWAFGTGMTRVGGRWIGIGGINNAVWTPFQSWSGELKMYTGTVWDGFVTFKLDKHWNFRGRVTNILDNTDYSPGASGAVLADPAQPRTFVAEVDFAF